MLINIIFIIFCIWILFFGGAQKLEDTLLGFIEFGRFGSSSFYIKLATCLALILTMIKMLQ